ncbi:metallophosphoesterase family protein [candidate division KSB1 bacterium]|nr:metallophosphoesterase family protein [candidate division KSB1 bacterium]
MKIGLIADIHANFDALVTVLDALSAEKVDKIICLGDLVGYGPDPMECIRIVSDAAETVLAGNHDHAAAGLLPIDQFNPDAKAAMQWTQDQLDESAKNYLKSLPIEMQDGDLMAIHATPEAPEKFLYIMKEMDIKTNLDLLKLPLCIVAHSHVPGIFVKDNTGDLFVHHEPKLIFADGSKYLINIGSIGQPRDGNPNAAFGVLDRKAGTYELKRIPYDVENVQRKMAEKNLPGSLIDRLAFGR